MKSIKITCQGADVLNIDQLVPFQGSLKTLSKSAFAKLKKSMIDFGFSFPLFVWKHGGSNWTLDGHQRISTLQEMRKEGFEVPELPVVWIEAKDEKEAKHKLLLAVGQYGKVTDEGLYEYIKTACLEMGELNQTIELGEFDFGRFIDGYGTTDVDLPDGSGTPESKMLTCPKCNFKYTR
jgi:hypothetical protein